MCINGVCLWDENVSWWLVSYSDEGQDLINSPDEITGNSFWWMCSRKKNSMVNLVEIDCKSKRFRVLQTVWYAKPMARGGVVKTKQGPGEWAYPPPRSLGDTFVRLICSK